MKISIHMLVLGFILLALLLESEVAMAARPGPADVETQTQTDPPTTEASGGFNSLTFNFENDFFAGTDRDYTNGLKLTWSTPYAVPYHASLPAWSTPVFNWLPLVNQPGGAHAVTLAIGQDIYTPEDTAKSELLKNERPYAGRTYLAAGFHTRRAQRKDSWEISIGIVGPASLAHETQNLFHDLISSDRAQGWANQLNNELTVDAICETRWRTWASSRDRGLNFDLIPHVGGSIGTVNTYLNTGAEIRIGMKLPNDFGSCPIRAGCETDTDLDGGKRARSRIHFFLAVDGKAIARDIFLDGNTFTDSHRVDKKNLVAELMAGFVWQMGQVKTTYSYVYRTQEYETQLHNQIFGSISITWAY